MLNDMGLKTQLAIPAVFLAGLALSSCSLTRIPRPNILVLAVDHLSVRDISCNRDPRPIGQSGFDLMCTHSVRFTHAYTTSLLSQPALTSLLTGLYPFEHNVHNNGPDFLQSSYANVARAAHQLGYRTALFSGGAPVVRSTGLQNGFELFEDNINFNPKKVFRSCDESFSLFSSWQKESEAPFFSVIYLPDLLFVDFETTDEFGERRNRSFESQLENLDTVLGRLLSRMNKEKIFDHTEIVLVGLNGHAVDSLDEENPMLNLHSDQIQVSALIKPAENPRDEGLSWSFDGPISLADIGRTLFETLETPPPSSSAFETVSLIETLKKPNGPDPSHHWIYAESYWGVWHQQMDPVFSFRNNSFSYIHDQRDHFFNTLTDRQETSEIPINDPMINEFAKQVMTYKTLVREITASKERATPKTLEAKNNLAENSRSEAFPLIRDAKWKELRKWAEKNEDQNLLALADRNLGSNETPFTDPCLLIIDQNDPQSDTRRSCSDRNLLLLSDYFKSEIQPDSHPVEYFRKRVQQISYNESVFQQIALNNDELHQIWNISEARVRQNLLVSMALHMPHNAKAQPGQSRPAAAEEKSKSRP